MADGDYHDPDLFSRGGLREFVPSAAEVDHIEAAPNLFERAARRWEIQSRHLGLNPSRATPAEIARERFEEFWAIWDRLEKGAKP